MKHIIGLMAMLLPILCGAQSPPVKALSIGDTVPDIVFNHVINYKDTTAKLSDFEGGLVLLDFWSTWCSACINGFPKMDSLRKEYKQLQVLLVNTKSKLSKDDETKIQKTLKNVKQRTGIEIQLPIVYDNPTLDSLFPVLYLPQVVWIKNNKVIAITGSDEVSQKNIAAVLKGEEPKIHLKKDLLSYNPQMPLFIDSNGGNGKQMLYRSLLAQYTEGVGRKSGYRVSDQKITGVYILNHSLLSLLKKANSSLMPANRIIIESDNENFKTEKTEYFKYANFYCYELIIPPSTEEEVKEYIRQDLEKYFRITVHNEKRKINCLVLYLKKGFEFSLPNNAKKGIDLEPSSKNKYIYNRPVPGALRLLNEYSRYPMIDGSDISTNIFIDLPFDLSDINALKKSFAKAGFDLKEEERVIEVSVISDL